jgi:hypothetical protein
MEEWKPVVGYEGYYEASSLGNVRRTEGIRSQGRGREDCYKYFPQRPLAMDKTRQGYLCASLCKNGRKKGYLVHRLVAIAFIPNPKNRPCVNHKDGVKTHNNIENLEWMTHAQNSKHAFDTGLSKNPVARGAEHGMSILTAEQVREIRTTYVPFVVSRRILSERYGVSESTIKSIVEGKHWKYT